ncbi:MAG: hypothetical protein V2A74_00545 [bacterium]
MGAGKIGVLLSIFVFIIVTGCEQLKSKPQSSSLPGDDEAPPVPSQSSAPSDMPFAAQVASTWLQEARAFAASHPGNEGLVRFVEVLEKFDTIPVVTHGDAITAIVKEGWQGANEPIAQLIQQDASILEAAYAVGAGPRFDFPKPVDAFSSVPNFLQIQLLCKLMLTEARRLEATGRPDYAATRALQTLRFSNHLFVKDVTLIQNLIAVAGQGMSIKVIESLLRNPNLSSKDAQNIGAVLYDLDKNRIKNSDMIRGESEAMIGTLRKANSDPAYRQKILNETKDPGEKKLMESIYRDFASFEAEHNKVWGAVLAEADKPYGERKVVDKDFLMKLTSNPAFLVSVPNFTEASTRWEVTLAHMRVTQAACAIKMGREDLASTFQDPFSGRPVVVTPDRVYSVGPGQMDMKGGLLYDPTNGTRSVGNIVVFRR